MKITIYELLGLVKDGKTPKEIKYKNFAYGWVQKYKTYTRYDITGKDLYITTNDLNDEVEVIEEPKKIEKLETYKEKEGEDYFANILKLSPNSECEIDEALSTTIDKLNELIDEINNLKEK